MICLEAEYFSLNRVLLQAIALWPFQQSKLVQLQSIIILIILVTAVMCQVKLIAPIFLSINTHTLSTLYVKKLL
jgi:hypothetical protein